MLYRYRFMHKISNPRPYGWEGTIEIDEAVCGSHARRTLGALLRQARLLGKGERLADARVARVADSWVRIVAFPQASSWHSIIFELVPRTSRERRHIAEHRLNEAAARYRWAALSPEAELLVRKRDPVNAPRILRERELYAKIEVARLRLRGLCDGG